MKGKIVAVRLPDHLLQKLHTLCEYTAETPSVVLRLLIATAHDGDIVPGREAVTTEARELLRSVR